MAADFHAVGCIRDGRTVVSDPRAVVVISGIGLADFRAVCSLFEEDGHTHCKQTFSGALGRSFYRTHVRDMHKTFLYSEPPVINSLPQDSSSPVSQRKRSLKRRQLDDGRRHNRVTL